MTKLSILLSTVDDRIYSAENILLHQFDDTEFIVVHQITDQTKTTPYQNFYAKFSTTQVKFIQKFEKGTGRSRNAAMENENKSHNFCRR